MYKKGHKSYLFRGLTASILVLSLGAGPGGRQMPGMGNSAHPIKIQTQFLSYGTRTPVFPAHASTYSHVYWNGTALVEVNSAVVTWAMTGTVPQVNGEGPFYPDGFSGTGQKGAGPFSATQFYDTAQPVLPGGTDISLTVEVLYNVKGIGTNLTFLSRYDGTHGIVFRHNNNFNVVCYGLGASGAVGPYTAASARGIHAATCTLSVVAGEGTGKVFVDGNSTATESATTGTLNSTEANTHLGVRANGHADPFDGTIYEVHVINAVLDQATIYARQDAALKSLGAVRGGTATFTRSTTAVVHTADSQLTMVPVNVPRVTSAGLWIEPSRTNLLLQSEDLSTSWNQYSLTTYTANQAQFMGRGVVADYIKTAAVADEEYSMTRQGVAGLAAGYYVFSYYAKSKAGAGTQHLNVSVADSGSLVALACSDCTVTEAQWTRCSVGVQYAGGTLIGDVGSNTNGALDECMDSAPSLEFYAAGAQLELAPNHLASSYVPTTTASVQRAADVYSISTAQMPMTASWCAHLEATGGVVGTSTQQVIFQGGTRDAANSFYLLDNTSEGLLGDIGDSASGDQQTAIATGTFAAGTLSVSLCSNNRVIGSEMYTPSAANGDATGAGTNVWSAPPTTIYLMNGPSATGYQGYLSKFKVCKNKGNPDSCK